MNIRNSFEHKMKDNLVKGAEGPKKYEAVKEEHASPKVA